MPRYRAQLGGMMGTGVYPDSRPQIDYGGLIDSVVGALATTREAVMRRAVLQQQVQRERERFDMEKQRFELSRRETQLQEGKALREAMEAGYEDVTDSPVPLTSSGQPQQMLEIGGRKLRLNPEKTPKAIKRAQYKTAGVPDDKLDLVVDNPSLAEKFLVPKQPSVNEKIANRVQELVSKGAPLVKANKQARLEFGESVPQDPQATGGVNPKTLQSMLRLQTRYSQDPDVKEGAQVAQSFDTVRASANDVTGASDMSLIFAYMKMLDPGSVVREGEFANAENTTGVPDRIRNLYNKAREGTKLGPKQRADFLRQAENLAKARQRRVQQANKRWANTSRKNGIDPEEFIYDPFDMSLESNAGNTAGSGSGGAFSDLVPKR